MSIFPTLMPYNLHQGEKEGECQQVPNCLNFYGEDELTKDNMFGGAEDFMHQCSTYLKEERRKMMAQHLQGAVQLIISFTFSSLSFRCLHFKMCNGKQAKIMLIMLKITDEAARGGESGLRRSAEQRLGRDGQSWFARSKAAMSEEVAFEFGYVECRLNSF